MCGLWNLWYRLYCGVDQHTPGEWFDEQTIRVPASRHTIRIRQITRMQYLMMSGEEWGDIGKGMVSVRIEGVRREPLGGIEIVKDG